MRSTTIFKYSYLNVFRHKVRSIITISGIFAATVFLICLSGLMDGMMSKLVADFTQDLTGKAQIHNVDYSEERSFYKQISNSEEIFKIAELNNIIASPRSYGSGLAANGNKSAGASIIGLNPEKEKQGFKLYKKILGGDFLSSKAGKTVLLGKKLAKTLKVGLGDEVILIVQSADGSMGNDIYYVSGILKSISDEFDRSTIIMHEDDFSELFTSSKAYHEIALITNDKRTSEEIALPFKNLNKVNIVETWQEIAPIVASLEDMITGYLIFLGVMFGTVAGIGVLNTMLMSAHDRIREYGMLKAIGASPRRIYWEMSLEGVLLGGIGVLLGTIFAIIPMIYLVEHGIDLTTWANMDDMSSMGMSFDLVMKANWSPRAFTIIPLVIVFLCWLISLYPARIARRTKIVEALHYE